MPLIIPGNSQSSTGFTIDQSIRFDDAAEHYMYSPTPSSSKNFSTTCTISLWFKIGNIKQGYLAGAFYGSNARYNLIQINANGQLQENGRVGGASTSTGSGGTEWTTTRVFKDPSAWYHAVFVWDTTNAVQSERFKLYINGVRETDFATSPAFGASELVYWFGKSSYSTLGAYFNGTGYADTLYFDGYMAEMHGVDGTALDQDSFGQFNSSGIWTPKEYTGSHGTDGFYIKGADASALGTNSAANGNNFTLNGISSHDQMADSPTNNYAVMNPLDTHTTPNWTLSNGNLDVSWNGPNYVNHLFSTLSMPSTGKWYFEIKWVSDSSQVLYYTQLRLGIMREDINAAYIQANTGVSQTGSGGPEFLVIPGSGTTSSFQGDGANITSFFSSFSMGDVLNFARDGTKLWVGKNGTYYNSGDPANGTNATSSGLELKGYRANMHWTQTSASHGTAVLHTFFGADKSIGSGTGFNDTVPTGFKALNTVNLGEA